MWFQLSRHKDLISLSENLPWLFKLVGQLEAVFHSIAITLHPREIGCQETHPFRQGGMLSAIYPVQFSYVSSFHLIPCSFCLTRKSETEYCSSLLSSEVLHYRPHSERGERGDERAGGGKRNRERERRCDQRVSEAASHHSIDLRPEFCAPFPIWFLQLIFLFSYCLKLLRFNEKLIVL